MEQAFKAVKMGILTWVLMGILIIYCLHYSFIICMHVEDFQLNACRHQTVQTVCSHNKIPCTQPPLTLCSFLLFLKPSQSLPVHSLELLKHLLMQRPKSNPLSPSIKNLFYFSWQIGLEGADMGLRELAAGQSWIIVLKPRIRYIY